MKELTRRENEVAKLVATGASNADIAVVTGIRPSTVKAHIVNIFNKLRITNRTQLAIRYNQEEASNVR